MNHSSRQFKNQITPFKSDLTPAPFSIVIRDILLWGIILSSLYALGRANYLLFHSLAEIFSIVVACGVFLIAWNTRDLTSNGFFLFIGVAFLFIAGLDVLHMLAYKGMGVFPRHDANLPTQLWIAARYLQGISLLVAPLTIQWKPRRRYIIFAAYTVATVVLLAAIFWGIFPDSYIEGSGLTPFKIISEYVIVLLMIGGLILLVRKREHFSQRVLFLLVGSIVFTIFAESMFTAYRNVYGLANLIGHLFKLVAFYLIYRALIDTALNEPYEILFRDLKTTEDELRRVNVELEKRVEERTAQLKVSEERFRKIFEAVPVPLAISRMSDGLILAANDRFAPTLEIPPDEVIGQKTPDFYENLADRRALISALIEQEHIHERELRIRRADGSGRSILISMQRIEHNGEAAILTGFQDITERKAAQEAVQRSEARLRALVQNSVDAITVVNAEGSILYDSPPIERILGYTIEERAGISVFERVHSDDLDRLQQAFGKLLEAPDKTMKIEMRLKHKNGSWRIIETTGTNLLDDPAIKGIVINWHDVTERREVEQSLRRERDLLDQLMVTIPVGITTVDRSGQLTFANPHAQQILDLTEDEVSERVFNDPEFQITDFDGNPFPEEELPFSRVMTTGKSIFEVQHAIQWLDGHRVLLSINGAPLFNGADELDGGIFVIEDVTERIQMLHTLAENEERFRRVFTESPIGMAIVDLDFRFEQVNTRLLDSLGYSEEELVGQPFADITYPPDLEADLELANQLLRGEIPHYQIEKRYIAKNGEPLWINLTGTTVRGADGDLLYFLAMIEDIQQRKEADEKLRQSMEDLKRSNEELERFAYVASHDLQEPLRMVASYLQLIKHRYYGKLDEDADEFIRYAVDGANRMRTLIRDLLAYSRINTRARPLGSVDCEEVVQQVLSDLAALIGETDAEITHDPLPTIHADATQMHQLFSNLIGNAIKFRREQYPPRIHIGVQRQEGEWQFCVQDNGIGFDADVYGERIFVIFQQLHSKVDYGGTGIGLAICKKIVERHGGRIWAESDPGEGSTFHFTLPGLEAADAINSEAT